MNKKTDVYTYLLSPNEEQEAEDIRYAIFYGFVCLLIIALIIIYFAFILTRG
jgi:ABC-type multidrug transport system permease subunit